MFGCDLQTQYNKTALFYFNRHEETGWQPENQVSYKFSSFESKYGREPWELQVFYGYNKLLKSIKMVIFFLKSTIYSYYSSTVVRDRFALHTFWESKENPGLFSTATQKPNFSLEYQRVHEPPWFMKSYDLSNP